MARLLAILAVLAGLLAGPASAAGVGRGGVDRAVLQQNTRPQAHWGLATTRNFLFETLTSANRWMNAEMNRTATTDIKGFAQVVVPLFTVKKTGQPQEVAPANVSDFTCSLIYNSQVIGRCTFNGQFTGTGAGGTVVKSDRFPISQTILKGTAVKVRFYFHNESGILWSNDSGYDGGANDNLCVSNTGGVVTDMTGSTAALSTGGGSCVSTGVSGPGAVLAYTDQPSTVLTLDSIGKGYLDTSASDFRQGIIGRGMRTNDAFWDLSSGGGKVNDWRTNSTFAAGRLEILRSGIFNNGVSEGGTNDLHAGSRTAAQTQGDIEWLLTQAPGARWFQSTVVHKASSADSFQTLVNQTTSDGPGSELATLNVTIRARGIANQYGVWDVAAPIENDPVGHDGKFLVNGSVNYCAMDNVTHPSPVCYALGAAAVDPTQLRSTSR